MLIIVPVLGVMLCTGCSKKVATGDASAAAVVNPADYLPFSKALKYRLDQDKVDIRKIQFYVDKPLILRHTTAGNGGSTVKGGAVQYESLQNVTEVTIPAYTPGICERVKGDSLMISFDAPNNQFVFAAVYANEHFALQGTNWYNGVADVMYDGKVYKVACDGCGSAGEVNLVIRRSQASDMPKPTSGTKSLAGRKLN